MLSLFQSTPPVRGATACLRCAGIQEQISIHAPRAGGDDMSAALTQTALNFNPRPPCGGRRLCSCHTGRSRLYFNPRPPCGGRHSIPAADVAPTVISIHAPRAGGDAHDTLAVCFTAQFQSTPPVRGATLYRVTKKERWTFQSTPPVRGATATGKYQAEIFEDFNPRPPCGGRPLCHSELSEAVEISIHAPRAGGDATGIKPWLRYICISIHAPRAGGDL